MPFDARGLGQNCYRHRTAAAPKWQLAHLSATRKRQIGMRRSHAHLAAAPAPAGRHPYRLLHRRLKRLNYNRLQQSRNCHHHCYHHFSNVGIHLVSRTSMIFQILKSGGLAAVSSMTSISPGDNWSICLDRSKGVVRGPKLQHLQDPVDRHGNTCQRCNGVCWERTRLRKACWSETERYSWGKADKSN